MGFVPLKAFAPSCDLGRVGQLKVDLPLLVSPLTLPPAPDRNRLSPGVLF